MSHELTISYTDNKFTYNKQTAPPSSSEEIKLMVISDISFLTNALANLILIVDENGYGDKKELTHAAIKTLYEYEENNKMVNNMNEDQEIA